MEDSSLRSLTELGKVSCPIMDKQLKDMSLEELNEISKREYLPADYRNQLEAFMKEIIYWNPYNKVVLDHRDGTIDHEKTNEERLKKGLPVPWTPEIGYREVREAPVY